MVGKSVKKRRHNTHKRNGTTLIEDGDSQNKSLDPLGDWERDSKQVNQQSVVFAFYEQWKMEINHSNLSIMEAIGF